MSDPLRLVDSPPVSTQLANLLLSGKSGRQLLAELRERYPRIGREEVFFGIVLAWTIREADLVEVELELSIARGLLAKLGTGPEKERAA